MRSRYAAISLSVFALALAACGTTVQTTSGREYLSSIPASAAPVNDIDREVREAANVEPILRFPVRIGLAHVGNAKGRPTLLPLGTDEARGWSVLADDLGPEYGEFVPISPLIATMFTPEHRGNDQVDATRDVLEMVRLAAARQHLGAVLIYEAEATADSKNNPLSIADWTIIGAFVLPSQDVKAQGVAQAILLDVRNGYHYGTVQATADDKRLAARFASNDAERDLSKRVEIAAVENLTHETRNLMRQLKVRLTALDKPAKVN